MWAIFGGREQCNNAPEWEVEQREIKVIARRLVEQEKANKDKSGGSGESAEQVAKRQFGR